MKSFIDKYFSSYEEYPDPAESMLEIGLYHEYVSSTFLNGWINYVDIIAARLITRYNEKGYQGNVDDLNHFNDDSTDTYHTKLGNFFNDDVFILAKNRPSRWYDNVKPVYWFFWFDRDVSDCCIGRFHAKGSSEDEVIKDFIEYANYSSRDLSVGYAASKEPVDSLEINVKKLRGWISF